MLYSVRTKRMLKVKKKKKNYTTAMPVLKYQFFLSYAFYIPYYPVSIFVIKICFFYPCFHVERPTKFRSSITIWSRNYDRSKWLGERRRRTACGFRKIRARLYDPIKTAVVVRLLLFFSATFYDCRAGFH